jgi:hypothetical protein
MNNYKHSGEITLLGVLGSAAAGLAAGFGLALIYAWGIIQISEEHAAGLATLAFGALIGAAVWGVARLGKVRNAQIVGIIAACAATVSLYCSWAFWVENVYRIFGEGELNALMLMQRPHELWEAIKLINQEGTWGTTAGHPTKGTELWILWACEAIAVVGAAALTAVTGIQSQPFCETCQVWCSATEKLVLSPVSNIPQTKRQIAQRDFSFLQKLGAGNKKYVHLKAELHSCPNCRELNTLTLQQSAVPLRRYRSPYVTLADKLLISRAEADSFRKTAAGLKQLAKAAYG